MKLMRVPVSLLPVLALAGTAAADPPENGPADGQAAPADTTGYDGGFFLRTSDDRYALKIQGRVQTRYSLESLETAGERETEQGFAVQRARLTLKGHVHSKAITYKFQSDFGKGSVSLKDFFVDYRLPTGDARFRAGQFKRPFSRQQITSSGRLELVDRAITDEAFDSGRDIGVAVHNNYEKSPTLEWIAGVFNGDGLAPPDPMTGEPAEVDPAFVGRVGYNYNGIKGYSEADLEGGPLRFAVGASGLATTGSAAERGATMRGEIDYAVKLHGLSSTGGVFVLSDQAGDGMMDQEMTASGAHVQLGYMISKLLQPAVRAAIVESDTGSDVTEITGALSLYDFSHSFKWQTDASILREDDPMAAETVTDYQVRTQLQLAF